MKLITAEIRKKLVANWHDLETNEGKNHDPYPVVKFFNPLGRATWLFTEMLPDNQDILFGLCDLGMGFPELGYASLKEIESIRVLGDEIGIEHDRHFTARYPLSVYSKAARTHSGITFNRHALLQAQAALESEKRRKKLH